MRQSKSDLKKSMTDMGAPEAYVDALLELFRFLKAGRAPLASTAIKDVTGRDPISFDQFARDYAAAWRG